jgi:Flp pilus assembly protein TadG
MRNLILGLARPLLRLLGRDESGAVAVIVALMLGTGVLTGIGALVIDVGQLYVEQGQLQNGADAAALAVAKSCAAGVCTPSAAASTALTYADENAKDGSAAVPLVCGSGGTLAACSATTGKITDCPAVPPAGTNYVDVHTSTKTASGGTVIVPIFADTLLGNSHYTGTTVLACAQAEWGGAVMPGIITAFTISACEWQKATTSGTVYGPVPPTAPSSTLDQVLKVRSGTGAGCTSYAAPDDAVNLFGWITETGGCTLNSVSGPTYSVLSGSSSPNCNTPLFDDAQDKTEIYIPVYTKITGSGASAVYNLLGIAAFVVTGYNIPGSSFTSYTDWLNSANQCTGTTYCINGYFVNDLVPFTGSFSTASVGLNAIKLAG